MFYFKLDSVSIGDCLCNALSYTKRVLLFLFVINAAYAAPVVTFEPGSAPEYNPGSTDSGMVINSQFSQSHGVIFSTENGSTPMLVIPGVAFPNGSCAYVSPCNATSTGNMLYPGFSSGDFLIVSFLEPVISSTGDILDIELTERVYIDALDVNGHVLESVTLSGPGNLSVISWIFTRTTADISSLRISANGAGWALDNISGVSAEAASAQVERVSVSSTSIEGSMQSTLPVLSGDGQLIAFESQANNLIDNDVNQNASDIFLRDRTSGTLELISVSSSGTQADKTSSAPAITPDGRYVAFHSQAENLIPVDTNTSAHDIYIRDRQLGITELVSIDSTGQQQPGENLRPAISNDAQIIVFETMSAFDPSDTNNNWDIYVRDRQSGVTTRISTAHDGSNSNGKSIQASISGDGRYVVYESTATNLVAAGANGNWHVYLHDRQLGTTQKLVWGVNAKLSNNGCCIAYRGLNFNTWKWDIYHYTIATQQSELVSQSSDGIPANSNSDQLNISGDGEHVVFTSAASNLVTADNNDVVDTFIRDMVEGITQRVSVSQYGFQSNNHSLSIPAVSGNGNAVAFSSLASNLVASDANSVTDVFVATTQTTSSGSSSFWMEMIGVVDEGGMLTKTAERGWENAGAASLRVIPGDGALEFTVSFYSTFHVGLSSGNSSASWLDIDYAIGLSMDGRILIYENGTTRGSFNFYNFGDVFLVERVGSTIYYKRNDITLYTSTAPSTDPLLVDASIYYTGSSIVGARLIGETFEDANRDGLPD